MRGLSLDDQLFDLIQRIGEAPFTPEIWPLVLTELALITGGWGCQLFGVADGRVLFNLGGGIPREILDAFEARGGADPSVNPRLRAAIQAPAAGAVLTEPDFISDADRARHPFYQEFLNGVETPYAAAALVSRSAGLGVYTAILRSGRQGPVDDAQRAICQALIPSLALAARAQVRLEAQSAAVALGAMEMLTLPAVLCDHAGHIVAATPTAEDLLSRGGVVDRRDGRLRAVAPECDRELQAALARAASRDAPCGAVPVVLFSADGETAAVADIFRLPLGDHAFAVEARTMVTIAAPRRRSGDLLLSLGLTRAEADVARHLADGLGLPEIAAQRGSAVETVRSQVKAVYAKLDVRRRPELAAKLRGLI